MEIKMTFRGMESSPVIEEYISKHMDKITKFLKKESSPIELEIVLDAAFKHHYHRAEIILNSPNYNLVSHYECHEMYPAIEKAIEKMATEISKSKGKRIDFRKTGDTFKGI